MTRFKESLLEQLLHHQHAASMAATTSPTHPPWRPWKVGVLVTAALAALVTSVVMLGLPRDRTANQPERAAYTLVDNHDDTVTFTVHRPVDTAAATRDLRSAGIPAVVRNAEPDSTCATSLNSIPTAGQAMTIVAVDNDSIRLRRNLAPAGTQLLIVVVSQSLATSQDDQLVTLQVFPITGAPPACVSIPPAPTPTKASTPSAVITATP